MRGNAQKSEFMAYLMYNADIKKEEMEIERKKVQQEDRRIALQERKQQMDQDRFEKMFNSPPVAPQLATPVMTTTDNHTNAQGTISFYNM